VAAQSTPSCVLSPALTEGPYFVEEGLVRSDIRSDPGDGSVKDGRLLRLRLTVLKVSDSACTPYEGATVDLWHCDAAGLYSDVAANGTVGKKFLRGSQVSDADGLVEFMTIFPGWYSGRTVHIHFKVRTYDGSSTTYEFTSQLFFDSSLTSAVYSQAPYSSRGAPGTTNSTDNIYDSSMVVPVSRSGSELVGAFSVGLSGLPGSSSGGSDDPSTPDASLTSARFARNAAGARILVLRLDVNEQVSADARLVRGGRVLARKRVQDLRAGSRRLNVRIGDRVRSGSARLKLTLRDADGNVKTIGRRLRVPGRARAGSG